MTANAHGIIDDNGEHACWGVDGDGVIWVRPVEDVHLPDSDVPAEDRRDRRRDHGELR
jgi:hypothetical protein